MEQITIDLVPMGVAANAHATQFDVGRGIRFNLKNGGTTYTLAGTETITIEMVKPDGSEQTISLTNTSSTYVDWTTADGELDQAGVYSAEISVTQGDDVLGSRNFFIKTEPDPYDGKNIRTITVGPADICTFETTLPEPLQSVLADVVASGGNGTPDNPVPIVGYTEANITRCGVNLFDDDKLIIASYPYPSMTFDKATYLKAGTYTASISNVDNATSWRFGYRFFNADGTIITSAITNGLVSFTAGTAFLDAYDSNQTCLQASDNTETSVKFTLTKECYIVCCISNGNVGATTTLDYQIETGASASSFVAYNGTIYTIAFGQTVYGGVLDVTRGKLMVTHNIVDLGDLDYTKSVSGDNWVFIANSPADSFANYVIDESNIPFNSDIYEGIAYNPMTNLDNTFTMNNQYTGSARVIRIKNTSYNDADAFKTAMENHVILYPLDTPFDIDLTPVQIRALVGENNVFADCGQTTVEYLAEG